MHTYVTVNFTPSQPGRLYQGVREKEGEYRSLIIPMVSVDVEHYETEKERKKERKKERRKERKKERARWL